MSLPRSRRDFLCRRRLRRGLTTSTTRRSGPRCRRSGCRERTSTPSSRKRRHKLPATSLPRHAAGPLLFPLSSTSADELRQTARRLAEWVGEQPDSVVPSDLAYTLARRRAHRPVRTAVVAADLAELTEGLREIRRWRRLYQAAVGQDDRGPVWVFSGQGSQWAAMGADLLASEPVFAATVAALEPLIAQESGFSVTEAMTAPETVTGIDRVQPTLFAMQVALAATMRSPTGCGRARSSDTRWANRPRPSSRGHCRWKTVCASSAAAPG